MIVNQNGSKAKLAPGIISMFPKFDTLIVPFFGGGRLSYYVLDQTKCKYVIANDLNNDVYCFWMTVKFNTERFLKEVHDICLHSKLFKEWAGKLKRDQFLEFISGMSENDKMLWKAVRYFILQNAGLMCAGTSSLKLESTSPKKVLLSKIDKCLSLISNIKFNNKDFREFFKNISWKGISNPIIYCDPPYLGTRMRNNENNFKKQDLIDLIDILIDLDKPFFISENNTDEIQEIIQSYGLNYKTFNHYRIKKKVHELVITNMPVYSEDLFD